MNAGSIETAGSGCDLLRIGGRFCHVPLMD
jgi:hypothetical protein